MRDQYRAPSVELGRTVMGEGSHHDGAGNSLLAQNNPNSHEKLITSS